MIIPGLMSSRAESSESIDPVCVLSALFSVLVVVAGVGTWLVLVVPVPAVVGIVLGTIGIRRTRHERRRGRVLAELSIAVNLSMIALAGCFWIAHTLSAHIG